MAFTAAHMWLSNALIRFFAMGPDLNFLLADEKWAVDLSL
jgi:hypothetical protein